uniref:Reverse transcriptase domain-containing protein n=1 Tax=Tanacetum cinerariifolium TaxID=118510 RepID=A0A6L2L7K5_TANCI|nr:reverse transcriptase domain-containing protein [Tanacetum cinerariifolium]
MANNRTMEELLKAPTKAYGEAIVISEINADHFEINPNLLQLVQANPYHGFERENPHTRINNFKRITWTLKFSDVPNDVIKLMIFPYSLEGSTRVWYDKEPPNSILTWEDLANKFVNQFVMLKACPHHGFTELTQIDTFYNGLNENDQDSLNAAAGGNLLSKTNRVALHIIQNKLKVHYSRNKTNIFRMNTTSRENASKIDDRIDKLTDQILTLVDILTKKIITPATVKAIEESCVTCGASTSGTLSSNTIRNPKGEMKVITTRSGVAYKRPSIPTNPSPKKVVEQETKETPISEPDVAKTLPKPNIPYPSRHNDQKLHEKATNQMEKFFQSSQELQFDISFADALLLMSKFASTIKSLLGNKDKLFELARTPLNKNCSAMPLKNLPANLRDPNKFLIPCDFLGMDICHALADLGASINLMPLCIWKKGAYGCILGFLGFGFAYLLRRRSSSKRVYAQELLSSCKPAAYGHSTFGANPFVPIDDLGSMMPLITYETLSKRWIVRGERVGWFVTTDPNTMFKNATVNTTRRMFEIKTGGYFKYQFYYVLILGIKNRVYGTDTDIELTVIKYKYAHRL